MKTKNLILGAAAFTLALGGAFASSSLPLVATYVKSTTAPVCRATSADCTNSGSGTCTVRVFNAATGTNQNVPGYDSTCPSTALKHTNSNPIVLDELPVIND